MKQFSVTVTEYGSVTQITIHAENDIAAENKAKAIPGISKVHKVWQLVNL